MKTIMDIRKYAKHIESVLNDDLYELSSSLKEAQDQYKAGQSPFYIYSGIIERVDKIINKLESWEKS